MEQYNMRILAEKITFTSNAFNSCVFENSTIEMTVEDLINVMSGEISFNLHNKSVVNEPIEQGLIDEGYVEFCNLCDIWIKNFGVVDAEQPDRANLLLVMASNYSLQVISYIKASGGLTQAVHNCLAGKINNQTKQEIRKFCRIISENMSQVSSILYPPLSDLLELEWQYE